VIAGSIGRQSPLGILRSELLYHRLALGSASGSQRGPELCPDHPNVFHIFVTQAGSDWCFYIATSPAYRGAKYCYQCVCPSACLPAGISIKTTRQNFTKFSKHLIWGLGSVLLWQQWNTLCTSAFVDDARSSHNGANGPESNTARVSSRSPGGGTGPKSAFFDCILLIFSGNVKKFPWSRSLCYAV